MEIKDFVKNVLNEITEATEEASNPKFKFMLADKAGKSVGFDLAVTVSDVDSESKEGKAGIKVASIVEAGGNLSSGKTLTRENTTRVQFSVGYRDLVEEQEFQQALQTRNFN